MYRQTSPNVDSESFGAELVSMIKPAQREEVRITIYKQDRKL